MSGPLGGLIGGAVMFLLLEMGYKRLRERYGVAEALAAELANTASDIAVHIKDQNPDEIPAYFRTSHVVFDALASRVAELPYDDVLAITSVYRSLDELNRMPAAWREHAMVVYSWPEGHPDKAAELTTLKDGRAGFYDLLAKIESDCRGLATHLRTKHTLGWRRLIPIRFRPERSADLPPRSDA